MSHSTEPQRVDELLEALGSTDKLKRWLEQHLGGATDSALLADTFTAATRRLLGADPPQTARWERLLVVAADCDPGSDGEHGCPPCRAAIAELTEMIQNDAFREVAPVQLISFAGALTLILTAERKLRQPIELAMESLCRSFADLLPEMADRSQDIWRRNGQMSGAEGLFLWDNRNHEWRLRQDFKAHRPTT